MQSENRTSKNRELEECLQDSETRNNLLGFFETLLEITKENPELIEQNPVIKKEKSVIKTK